MNKCLKKLLLRLCALFTGALLTLAFAPYDIFPLAILAPALLMVLLLHASPSEAFWRGFLFGIGWFGTGTYWVFISIQLYGGVAYGIAGIITAGFIAVLALFPAMNSYWVNRYFPFNTTPKWICAFPAIWVLLEWVRSWIFTGFPWLLLGYSQTNSPLKGYAPLLSVYGVSLAVLLSSTLMVNAVLQFRQKVYSSTYLHLFACTTIWITGGLLCLIAWTSPSGNPLSVSLVQGNIPQEIKWSPTHIHQSLTRYQALTKPLWKKDQVIIWPEAAIPLAIQDISLFIEEMDEKAKAKKAHLIFGVPIQGNSGYYNAVISLGGQYAVYLKRRLVPFGEYMPMPSLLSRLFSVMHFPMSNIVPGKTFQPPFVIHGVKTLVSICYEIAFPELIAGYDQTVGMLLTVTNDAWFGKSAAQAQHLQIAAMRAIEMRRPLLFVSNNGITAIINTNGQVTHAAPPRQSFVLNGLVQPVVGWTPWQHFGMDPVLLLLAGLLFIAIRDKLTHQV